MVFLASLAPAPNFLERLHRPARLRLQGASTMLRSAQHCWWLPLSSSRVKMMSSSGRAQQRKRSCWVGSWWLLTQRRAGSLRALQHLRKLGSGQRGPGEDLELDTSWRDFSESDPSPIRQCYGGEHPTQNSVPGTLRNPGKSERKLFKRAVWGLKIFWKLTSWRAGQAKGNFMFKFLFKVNKNVCRFNAPKTKFPTLCCWN